MHRRPHSHHHVESKEQALLNARQRDPRSVQRVANALNMSPGTLKRWLQDAGRVAELAPGTNLALDGAIEGRGRWGAFEPGLPAKSPARVKAGQGGLTNGPMSITLTFRPLVKPL